MAAHHELNSRLEKLWQHLSDEGWHVHANTVSLCLDMIDASNMMKVSLVNCIHIIEEKTFEDCDGARLSLINFERVCSGVGK